QSPDTEHLSHRAPHEQRCDDTPSNNDPKAEHLPAWNPQYLRGCERSSPARSLSFHVQHGSSPEYSPLQRHTYLSRLGGPSPCSTKRHYREVNGSRYTLPHGHARLSPNSHTASPLNDSSHKSLVRCPRMRRRLIPAQNTQAPTPQPQWQ